jgi:hypothetical protein
MRKKNAAEARLRKKRMPVRRQAGDAADRLGVGIHAGIRLPDVSGKRGATITDANIPMALLRFCRKWLGVNFEPLQVKK